MVVIGPPEIRDVDPNAVFSPRKVVPRNRACNRLRRHRNSRDATDRCGVDRASSGPFARTMTP